MMYAQPQFFAYKLGDKPIAGTKTPIQLWSRRLGGDDYTEVCC